MPTAPLGKLTQRGLDAQDHKTKQRGRDHCLGTSGLTGGASGAPGETLKRKREETDSDPGIDIDFLNTSEKLSAPNGAQKSSKFADPMQKTAEN